MIIKWELILQQCVIHVYENFHSIFLTLPIHNMQMYIEAYTKLQWPWCYNAFVCQLGIFKGQNKLPNSIIYNSPTWAVSEMLSTSN